MWPHQTSYSCKLLQTFTSVTEQFVLEILQKTIPKLCDLDASPTKLLCESLDILLSTITNIINTSLASGVVSPDLKTASVNPLLKKTTLPWQKKKKKKKKKKEKKKRNTTGQFQTCHFCLKSLRKSFYTNSLHISKKRTSTILSNLPTTPDAAPRPPLYELLMIC